VAIGWWLLKKNRLRLRANPVGWPPGIPIDSSYPFLEGQLVVPSARRLKPAAALPNAKNGL
jgi:hypothetical protein